MSYFRPAANCQVEQIVKKSQFIAHLNIVDSIGEADDIIRQIKSAHPKASHNCHCYIAGSPEQSSLWAYSDDGEPKGCAGLPMFQVLKHSGLGNTCVVVTRYFGGIKLGTGGMARAYSSTVNLAIDNIERQITHSIHTLSLVAPFHLTGAIETITKNLNGATITARDWRSAGQQFVIQLEEPAVETFMQAIASFMHLLSIEQDF